MVTFTAGLVNTASSTLYVGSGTGVTGLSISGIASSGTAVNATNPFGAITAKTNSATVTVGGSISTSYAGTIADNGAKTVALDVALTAGTIFQLAPSLTGNNTYSGGTSIEGGILAAMNTVGTQAFGTGAILVKSGGTIAGSGNISGASGLTFNSSSAFNQSGVLPSTAGTLTAGATTINGGTFNFRLGGAGVNDALSVTTLAVANAPTIAVSLLSGTTTYTAGSYNVIPFSTSATGLGNFVLSAPSVATAPNFTFALNAGSSAEQVIVGMSQLTWTGAGGATWDVNTSQSWKNGSTATVFLNSNSVLFDNTPGVSQTIAVAGTGAGTGVTPSAITFNNTSINYTINSSGGGILGSTGIVMNGTGTVTLNDASGFNNYSGGVTINAGTIDINSATSLGTGGATLTGGNLEVSGTFASGRTFSVSGNTGNNISVDVSQVYTLNSSSVIKDGLAGAGTLRVSGAGTLVLNGNNSYTGGTSISGTVRAGSASALGTGGVTFLSGGTLDLNGTATVNVSSISSAAGLGTITNNGAADSVLSLGGNVSTSYGGLISNGSTNKVGLLVNLTGAGTTLTLNGTNSFTGGVTLQSGTLAVATGGNLGGSGNQITFTGGTLALATGFTTTSKVFSVNTTGVIDVTSASASINGAISGSGSLTIQGSAGTLTLGGSNTNLSGNTTMNGATVKAGSATPLGTGLVTLQTGATLDLNGQTTVNVSNLASAVGVGTVSNSGGSLSTLNVNGGASSNFGGSIADGSAATALTVSFSSNSTVLQLSGSNTYSGGTTVNSGSLYVTGSLLSTGALTLNNAAAAVFSNAQQLGAVNNDSSAGTGLTFLGSATLASLGGSGVTQFNASSNIVTSLSGSGTLNLASGTAAVTVNGGSFGGSITGNGAVTVGGTLSLTGTNNSYVGNTTINSSGQLILSGGSITASTIQVNGGTLSGNGTVQAISFNTAGSALDMRATSAPATLNTGNVTFNGSEQLYFRIGSTGGNAAYDQLASSGTINFAGTNGNTILNLFNSGFTGSAVAGEYYLMTGNMTGTALTFANGTAFESLSGGLTAHIIVNPVNLDVDVNVGRSPITWGNFAGTNVWTVNDTNNNFETADATHALTNFQSADNVYFQDSSSLTNTPVAPLGTVNVSGAVNPSSITFSANSTAYVINTSAVNAITVGTLYKDGSAAASFTGNGLTVNTTTTVAAGVLNVASMQTTGNVTIRNSAGFHVWGTVDNSLSPSVGLVANGTASFEGNQMLANLTGAGGVNIASSKVLTLNAGSFSGVIGGAGGLTVAGDTTLTGINAYTGASNVNSGATLRVIGGGQLASPNITVTGALRLDGTAQLTGNSGNPTVTVAGGVLTTSNSQGMVLKDAGAGGTVSVTVSGITLTLGAGSSFNGVINGAGSVTIVGDTTLTGNNAYTGATVVNNGAILQLLSTSGQIASANITVSGEFRISASASLTGNSGSPMVTVAGGVVTMSNSQGMILKDAGAGGTVNLAASNTLTLGAGSSFGGVIGGTGGKVIIAGNTTLAGANTYSGGTTINTGVTAHAGNATALGTGTVTFGGSGSTLDVAGFNLQVGNLSGANGSVTNTNATAGRVTVTGGTSSNFGGSFANGTGTVGLSIDLTGGSTLTLSGNNSGASGSINLDSGTLAVSALNNLGTGAINFNGGTLAFYTSSFSFNNAIDVTSPSTIYVDNALTITSTGNVTGSTNALTKAGAGTLVFGGTVAGELDVTGGKAQVNPNNVGGNIVLSNGATVDFTTAGQFSHNITGIGNVEIANSITVSLSGSGSGYTGSTILDPGATLVVGNAGNIGSAGLSMSGSTLSVTGNIAGAIPVALASGTANTFNVANGVTFSTSGAIIGDAGSSILKNGSGTMLLAGANPGFGGSWNVNNGDVTVTGSGTLGTGAVTISPSGSMHFDNTSNLTSGITVYNGGTVGFADTNSFGGNITVATGTGTFSFAGGSDTTLTGSISKNGTVAYFVAGGDNAHVTFNGAITGDNANSDAYFNGATHTGTSFDFNGPMAYTGPTYVYGNATLTMHGPNYMPNPANGAADYSAVTLTTSGTLDINGFSQVIRSLADNDGTGVVKGSGGTLTVSNSQVETVTYNGQITGGVSMAFSGVAGSAQVLSSTNNNYTGTTDINSGALIINGSLMAGGGTVTVHSGAILGGTSGTIQRDVTVLNGGTVAPGGTTQATAVGSLALNGAVTMGGNYAWDLGGLNSGSTAQTNGTGGASFDQLTGLTSLTLNSSTSQLNLQFASGLSPTGGDGFWSSAHTWSLITGTLGIPNMYGAFSAITGSGGSWNGSTLNYGSGEFSLEYLPNSVQLDWSLTTVPEPGTMLLGTLAAMGLGGFSWRKRKSNAGDAQSNDATAV